MEDKRQLTQAIRTTPSEPMRPNVSKAIAVHGNRMCVRGCVVCLFMFTIRAICFALVGLASQAYQQSRQFSCPISARSARPPPLCRSERMSALYLHYQLSREL